MSNGNKLPTDSAEDKIIGDKKRAYLGNLLMNGWKWKLYPRVWVRCTRGSSDVVGCVTKLASCVPD